MTRLTDALPEAGADPTLAAMDTQAQQPAMPPPEEGLVTLFVTNGVAVSSGERTPSVVHVPPAEAADLAFMKLAVYGEVPPRGYAGDALPLPRAYTRNLPGTPRAGLRG